MHVNLIPSSDIVSIFSKKEETYTSSLERAGLTPYTCVQMEQTHGSDFKDISENIKSSKTIPIVDALITTQKQIVLTVRTADCLPILIYHPKPLIAAIHAGRRSTEASILKKVLHYIHDHHAINQDLSIWFGPAISKQQYEINPHTHECYDLIGENSKQIESVFSKSDYSLLKANLCTLENSDLCHSYRRNKTKKRHFSHIMIR